MQMCKSGDLCCISIAYLCNLLQGLILRSKGFEKAGDPREEE